MLTSFHRISQQDGGRDRCNMLRMNRKRIERILGRRSERLTKSPNALKAIDGSSRAGWGFETPHH